MPVIKLDAIDSTNDFLKELAQQQNLDDFTVVYAESQLNGKGQRGAHWISEPGKNLTMSVLIKGAVTDFTLVPYLTMAAALAVVDALRPYAIPQLSIKWPNDIMSGNYKVCGILIENLLKGDGYIQSVVGIGLNVNQTNFEGLPHATSLSLLTGRLLDKEDFLYKIRGNLLIQAQRLRADTDSVRADYIAMLFRKDVPSSFTETSGDTFNGVITGIDYAGRLLVSVNGEIRKYDIREIRMNF